MMFMCIADKSCYNFIKTSEETKQIATATEQQTAKGISTAFVTKPNPCSGHQQGRNHRRLKRPVICGNSATTVISPTQKPPKEKISNSSLEGAILSRSTEMTDSGATDSNTRLEHLIIIVNPRTTTLHRHSHFHIWSMLLFFCSSYRPSKCFVSFSLGI